MNLFRKEQNKTSDTALETFKYDAANMLVSGTYKDTFDAKKYHNTHKNDSVIIEYMSLKGAKKEMYSGKYEVLLDSHNNPLKMIEYHSMKNGVHALFVNKNLFLHLSYRTFL